MVKRCEVHRFTPPMKNSKPERDWLFSLHSQNAFATRTMTPPGPISGPIEEHHDPDLLLSHYRDEASWSEEITAWSRGHSLLIEEDEE
jgi:hypothetical protein